MGKSQHHQSNQQARTQTTKLAWRRDPSVPQGQPAEGTFTCPCGGVIGPVPFGGVAESLGMAPARGPQVHTCPGCGKGYDGRGWLVSDRVLVTIPQGAGLLGWPARRAQS